MDTLPKLRSIICAAIAGGIQLAGIASAAEENWSGFYGGLALGGAYGQSNPDTVTELGPYFTGDDHEVMKPSLQKNISGSALTGSVLAGYERTRGRMVYGIETDISAMDYSETSAAGPVRFNTAAVDFNVRTTVETNFAFSIRPKIGYTFDNWTLHAAAGPSIGYFNYEFRYNDTNDSSTNSDFNKSTLALGISSSVGASYNLNDGWSLRGDYVLNYYPEVIDERQNFVRNNGTSDFNASIDHQVDFQSHNLRIALIKRF
ncbi:outer membrane protein [Thalassospira sp. CH_XMU1458]|uniref:outer membrane protein n=1 Tax=Thalassospira sp. CH_XMU1458 TaxID=3107776 RepID=UPI00300D3710